MKALLLVALMSGASFAGTRVLDVKFSFTENERSFSEVFNYGQTVIIQYKVTSLPKPVLDDSFLKVEKEMECISWTSPGTSPDDPGTCGEYKWTGKYRVFAPYNPIELFSIIEVVTDLKSGIRAERKVPAVKTSFYIDRGEVLIDTPVVPKDLDLNFVSYVSADPQFGCAVEGYGVGPILGVKANIGICTSSVGKATLIRKNGEFKLTVSDELKFKTTITAWWMIRDFPRADYVRKDIWEDGEWAATEATLK